VQDWRYSTQGGRLPGIGPAVVAPPLSIRRDVEPRGPSRGRHRPRGSTPSRCPSRLSRRAARSWGRAPRARMTAPVATGATPRPSTSRPARRHVLRTRRVRRAYVHYHLRRARRPSSARCPRPRRAPAFAAPPRPPPPPPPPRMRPPADCSNAVSRLCTGIHADPVNTPESARPVRAACVCVSVSTRLPGTRLPHTVAGRCRGRQGCARQLAAAGLSPGCLGPVRSWASGREILSARVHPCDRPLGDAPCRMSAWGVVRAECKHARGVLAPWRARDRRTAPR